MIQTPYVKISELGIDILKNYSAKNHLDYLDIETILVKKGYLHNNWTVQLILGMIIILGGVLWGVHLYPQLASELKSPHNRWHIISLMTPWILSLFGAILIFQSLRKCTKLIIYTSQGKTVIAIPELEKQEKLADLVQFLTTRVNLKVE